MSLRERNRQQTREAILRAARLLMMRDGAAGTSMVEVAELAGVSDTTVFNYFKTKSDLMDAVVDEWDNGTQFLSLLATRPAEEGPFTALRNIMRDEVARDAPFDTRDTTTFLAAVRSDPALWGAYLRAAHESAEILAIGFLDRAPDWTRLQARAAAHATTSTLNVLMSEISQGLTLAEVGEQVDALLAQLERAWPAR